MSTRSLGPADMITLNDWGPLSTRSSFATMPGGRPSTTAFVTTLAFTSTGLPGGPQLQREDRAAARAVGGAELAAVDVGHAPGEGEAEASARGPLPVPRPLDQVGQDL